MHIKIIQPFLPEFWNGSARYLTRTKVSCAHPRDLEKGYFEDAESDTYTPQKIPKKNKETKNPEPPPRHFKMMCNTVVNGKRANRNNARTKEIVNACASSNIHIFHAISDDGVEYKCFREAQQVKPGDIAHMYYGDIEKGNAKHFVGKVLTPYTKLADSSNSIALDEIKKFWPQDKINGSIMCGVDWKEIPMTPEDEYMLKNPGKNGFKVQGTILRIK